ncbi:hypothetical protein PGT21_037060 [Puccinia graminis f. sp. tritici]|uniref:Uncharacterized protein n=1 Tax=Puccinia graminis f. sp. tritici TaxID=56615 RepID=A0A5B0R3D5_PUCGR|nr:hypothetical protein PGT21_037060 [Puccinia graminis f. sp. tritici]
MSFLSYGWILKRLKPSDGYSIRGNTPGFPFVLLIELIRIPITLQHATFPINATRMTPQPDGISQPSAVDLVEATPKQDRTVVGQNDYTNG